MPDPKTRPLICYLSEQPRGTDFVHRAFKCEAEARQYFQDNERAFSAASFEDQLERGGIAYLVVPEREFLKIEKTGVFAAAFNYQLGKNCNYPVPFVVSPTKTGLVKKARAAEPGNSWTEKSLFYGAAAFFLVEGYPVPAGFHDSGPYSGARVTRN